MYPDKLLQYLFLFAAGDNCVYKTMFQHEFGLLEALWQGAAGGLLDNAGAGKANGRAGLGENYVTLHGEAGGDAAGGGVCEHGDIEKPGVAVSLYRGAYLCHLHQRHEALLHTRAAGNRVTDDGQMLAEGMLKKQSDLFANTGAHAAHKERGLHNKYAASLAADVCLCTDDGFIFATVGAYAFELSGISGKAQWVCGAHIGKKLGHAVFIDEIGKPLAGLHAEMMAAGAYQLIFPEHAQRK